MSRLPLPTLAAYYTVHFALYVAACFVLLYAASVFCPGRSTWWALAVAFCAVPIRLYGWMAASAIGSIKWQAVFAAGLIDYGYDSADGLFRGGLSNSATLTAGTTFVLLTMALLARYLETQARGFLVALCGVTFLSALIHPFEVNLIVLTCAVPMLTRRWIGSWIATGISGACGMIPYLILGVRSNWLRDIGDLAPRNFHPLVIAADFGVPCILIVYLLLIRFRMPEARDTVLRSWFFAAPVLFIMPGIMLPMHLLDGFAYCCGFLLVRRISCDKQLRAVMEHRPRTAYAAFAGFAAVSCAALAMYYGQIWHDSRQADPLWLLSSVQPKAQRELVEWVRDNTPPDAVVLAPIDVAPWVATTPRITLASHDYLSITYNHQREQIERVFRGETPLQAMVDEYGVRIAVLPAAASQRDPAGNWRADIGPWRIYEFPEATPKPYPGLAVLDPSVPLSLRSRVLAWFAHR